MTSGRNPRISLGYHRCYIYGNVAEGGQTSRMDGIHSRTAPLQYSKVTEIWNYSPWYYHSGTLLTTIDDCTRRWFREFLVHGTVWTGASMNAVHRSQRLTVKPLKSSDWPRSLLGPSWPSFPSIPEWMEMLRRGVDPFAQPCYEAVKGDSGYTRVSRRELHDNHVIATRIVLNAIVGIRSSVEVPRKFLKYFRYGENFLILSVQHNLPIGLVRFLLGKWCVSPYSLWLRRASTLKQYLRKVPSSLVIRARLRLAEYSQGLYLAGAGSCTSPADYSSEYYSDGSSELD